MLSSFVVFNCSSSHPILTKIEIYVSVVSTCGSDKTARIAGGILQVNEIRACILDMLSCYSFHVIISLSSSELWSRLRCSMTRSREGNSLLQSTGASEGTNIRRRSAYLEMHICISVSYNSG